MVSVSGQNRDNRQRPTLAVVLAASEAPASVGSICLEITLAHRAVLMGSPGRRLAARPGSFGVLQHVPGRRLKKRRVECQVIVVRQIVDGLGLPVLNKTHTTQRPTPHGSGGL
jgi:hypothetical protein